MDPSSLSNEHDKSSMLFFSSALSVDSILVLLLQFHPDVNKDSKAGELFKSIRCSYEVGLLLKLLLFYG